MLGGHYTYAEVPAGFWLKDALGLARNPYDRLGHFAQGFVPAIVVREVLIRRSPLRPGKWLTFLVLCVCLAISALYELVEWWAALIGGEGADAFLGTQGDQWDTQWDMFVALLGAATALLLLSGSTTARSRGSRRPSCLSTRRRCGGSWRATGRRSSRDATRASTRGRSTAG